MSKKRQTRNSKKFKQAAASQRARMPKLVGGYVYDPKTKTVKPRPQSTPTKGGSQMTAGGSSGFDERTWTTRPTSMGSANPLSGMTQEQIKNIYAYRWN